MIQSGEGVADVAGQDPGPNSSLQFGQAKQMQQMAGQLKNDAPGAYRASSVPNAQGQQMQQGMPGGQPQGMPTQGGAPQMPPMNSPQPGPRQPTTAQDAGPGGRIFSQPRYQPKRPWKDDVRRAVNHPNGPFPFLNDLLSRAEYKDKQQQQQAQPAQGQPQRGNPAVQSQPTGQ